MSSLQSLIVVDLFDVFESARNTNGRFENAIGKPGVLAIAPWSRWTGGTCLEQFQTELVEGPFRFNGLFCKVADCVDVVRL